MSRTKHIIIVLWAVLVILVGATYQGCLVTAVACVRNAPTLRAGYYCTTGEFFDFETDYFGLVYEGNSKDLIDRSILFYGAWERPVLYFMRDTMRTLYSGRGVFLDVGANKGAHSLFMSEYASEIHAFDPYLPVVEIFKRALSRNDLHNVKIHTVGLGSEEAMLPFYEPPSSNQGTGSFVADFRADNSGYHRLQIVVGDQLLEREQVNNIKLIKIDIEGYEKPALQGMRRTLERDRPIVVMELSVLPDNPIAFKSIAELTAVFPPRYEFLAFQQPYDEVRGDYSLRALVELVDFSQRMQADVVAFPEELAPRIPRVNVADSFSGKRSQH